MDELVGRKVVGIRPMTRAMQDREGWCEGTTTIVFDDGTVLYASRDSEGNGPGALFGTDGKGRSFSV